MWFENIVKVLLFIIGKSIFVVNIEFGMRSAGFFLLFLLCCLQINNLKWCYVFLIIKPPTCLSVESLNSTLNAIVGISMPNAYFSCWDKIVILMKALNYIIGWIWIFCYEFLVCSFPMNSLQLNRIQGKLDSHKFFPWNKMFPMWHAFEIFWNWCPMLLFLSYLYVWFYSVVQYLGN